MTHVGWHDGAIDKPRRVGDAAEIALFSKVPHLRSNIADLHHGFETDVLLDPQREVIDGGCLRVGFNCIDVAWSCRIGRQISQVSNGSGGGAGNCQSTLERWIANQVAASGTAARTVCMINASHATKHCLAGASQVPRKADAWLPVNRLLLPETLRYRWIRALHYAVELIPTSRNEGSDQTGVRAQRAGHRVQGPSIRIRTTAPDIRHSRGAERTPELWRLSGIPSRGIEARGQPITFCQLRVVSHTQTIV